MMRLIYAMGRALGLRTPRPPLMMISYLPPNTLR